LQAKLGGAGLGLAALLELEKVEPDFTPLEDLRRLGRFVLYLQKPDGDFYAKYIPSCGGRRDDWVSLYYPGEAALGLVLLYERDSDPAWLRDAAAAIAYLAHHRGGQTDIPARSLGVAGDRSVVAPARRSRGLARSLKKYRWDGSKNRRSSVFRITDRQLPTN
jgi:hypothetical protein